MMFPNRLDSPIAYSIATAMLEGFDRHYQLFRVESSLAKARYECLDWCGQQSAQRLRIDFYDQRVKECIARLESDFSASTQVTEVWQQAKLHYIGLLINHHQPELAETFFNSVFTKIMHRSYFQNEFLFVRPAVSTEYLESDLTNEKPTYRCYYPTPENIKENLTKMIRDFSLHKEFKDLPRDISYLNDTITPWISNIQIRANFQIQVLSSLFFRNKGCYVVGKVINSHHILPFALPILHNEQGMLQIDTMLSGEEELLALFSFARAYFFVEMEVPSAYVQFLHSLIPRKPRNEIYNALGLAKQGKTLFYRDFLHHLRYSSDKFRIAPGIKGMVMLVFDQPSFPYVFKLIKDFYPPQKDTTREQIEKKYRLVKQHDRVGRMADTLEYSNVALPLDRFEDELLAEIKEFAPSQFEICDLNNDGNLELVLQHVYIERRMVPLNIYLQEAIDNGGMAPDRNDDQAKKSRVRITNAVIEYGCAIKDLAAANIFPGDMLWKNFGVTLGGKIIFYDYDEIEYITDCNFRRVPQAHNEEEELSNEIWYAVGKYDVFPETFAPFLLGNQLVKDIFMANHANLLDASFWQEHKERIQNGYVHDVFPYSPTKRFEYIYQEKNSLSQPLVPSDKPS